jgi:PmbA protein
MNYQELIKRSIALGFSDLEVYEDTSSNLSVAIFNGVVDKNEISDVSQVAIRAIYNGKMAYLDLENKDEDIDFVLNILKNNADSLTTEEEFLIYEGSENYPVVKHIENDFANYTNLDHIELIKKLEAKVKAADPRIVFVPYCNYEESKSVVRIINSKGLDISKCNEYCAVVVQAVARENEDSQSGFEVSVKLKYDNLDIDKICDDVVKKAVSMLNAKPVPSKVYPTIIDSEAMTDLFSSFQSVFSGEAAIKKITPLLGKENTQIMSELISIVDNPLKEDAIVIQPFDDEGVACYQKEIVKGGEFVTFLHNLKTARYFKTTSTGNGFKAGATIGVRGANLYIAPGTVSKEEMIKGIEEGLLLTSLEGLHAGVNPISGDFSLKASGFLIKNGNISRAITLIVASGNFFKLMNEVDTVGNDLELGYRGIGSPSIKFKGLSISGE